MPEVKQALATLRYTKRIPYTAKRIGYRFGIVSQLELPDLRMHHVGARGVDVPEMADASEKVKLSKYLREDS